MKIHIRILSLVVFGLFRGAYSIFDDSIFQDEQDRDIQLSDGSKYEVVVQKTKDETTIIWAGVIISKKFVLSVDVYDREKEYDPKHLSVIAGYQHVGRLQENLRNLDFANKKAKYHIEKIWLHRSIMLLKTKIPIVFNNHVRKIDFPGGDFLETWKNPFSIPERSEFTTTYWCRQDRDFDYYLYTVRKERRCAITACYRRDALFPSCIDTETKNKHCMLSPGAPLVYKGLLVGLRKAKQHLKPSNIVKDDYFINTAIYKKYIDKIVNIGAPMYPAPIIE